ncbi:MAG TPA: hypothetical protein VFC31_14915 [Candidatus Limnocylindria bacterium]|nr:hypothetical protein [Candidatus Limnocylindria bacterium]
MNAAPLAAGNPIVTLPLVLAIVLVELASGGAFLVWLLDRRGLAPGGFLKLTAGVDAVCAAAAVGLIPTIIPRDLGTVGLDPGPLGSFGQALVVFLVLAIIQFALTFVPVKDLRGVAGALTVVVGVATLEIAAIARPTQAPFDLFALLALPLGALALGGSDAAMLLGHWYLVTPKLSPVPLRSAALVVVAAVVLQIGVVAVSFARGDLAGATTEVGLTVAIGIRIGVGLLMTLGVALGGWWTARMNTQSSTGLLYVGLGTALAGEISARVLFFLTGTPV